MQGQSNFQVKTRMIKTTKSSRQLVGQKQAASSSGGYLRVIRYETNAFSSSGRRKAKLGIRECGWRRPGVVNCCSKSVADNRRPTRFRAGPRVPPWPSRAWQARQPKRWKSSCPWRTSAREGVSGAGPASIQPIPKRKNTRGASTSAALDTSVPHPWFASPDLRRSFFPIGLSPDAGD